MRYENNLTTSFLAGTEEGVEEEKAPAVSGPLRKRQVISQIPEKEVPPKDPLKGREKAYP